MRPPAPDGSSVGSAGSPEGAALERVAEAYEDTGHLLYAPEAWIEAAEACRPTRPSTARRAAARAQAPLDGPARGAATPAILRFAAPELTERERQVALAAADGRSNAEIAALLDRSVRAIEWHLQQADTKLGVHNRNSLADPLRVPEPRPPTAPNAGRRPRSGNPRR